jgi:hypothetical protein
VSRPRALALASFVALLFPAVVLEGRFLYERDVHLVWYPQVEAFVRALRSGAWPLWDPYLGFGHPLLANANQQALYPFTWLNLLLPPERVYVLLVLSHVAFGAFGMERLGGAIGLSRDSRFLAAALWAASGPLLSLGNVWHHLSSATWIPWIFLAAHRALDSPSLRRAALWGLAQGAQVLAGSPDVSLYTGLAVGAFVLLHEGRAPRLRRLAATAIALVFALGLSAGQWLPSLEVARRSARWDVEADTRTVGSLDPAGAVAKALSPAILWELPFAPTIDVRLTDSGLPFLRSLYLGLPALALVVASLVAPRSRTRSFLLGLGAAAFLFSMGPHTPFYGALVAVVPPLRSLRYPSKAMILVAFAWALLAGLGFDAWRTASPRARRALAGLLGALALAEASAAAIAAGAPRWLAPLLVPEEQVGVTWRQALAAPSARLAVGALLTAGAAVAAAWGARRGPLRTWVAPAVAVLAVADLWSANHVVNRTVPREFYRFRPPLVDAVERGPDARVLVYTYPIERRLPVRNAYEISRYPPRLDFEAGLALGSRLYLLPPLGGAWELSGSYDPDLLGLYPRPLAELVRAARAAEGTPAYPRLLQLGAVRYVAALHEDGLEGLAFERVLPSLLTLPLRLFRVPDPLPRTYVVGGARAVPDEAAVGILEDPAFDPRREVVLPDESSPSPPGFQGRSRIVEFRADRVRVAAELNARGYVVLVDAHDPGWRATVDGRPAPVLRANLAFRAVRVEAGSHEIVLEYRPWTAVLGAGLSASTAVTALALLLGRRASG